MAVVTGGDGPDVLAGTDLIDRVTGGAGDDVLAGGDGSDVVEGGAGNDTIYGWASLIRGPTPA